MKSALNAARVSHANRPWPPTALSLASISWTPPRRDRYMPCSDNGNRLRASAMVFRLLRA